MDKYGSGIKIGLFFLVFVFSILWSEVTWAKYPEKPILLIMCRPAGGGGDTPLRPLVNVASQVLGQPIAIEYHPGGSGAVGMGLLKVKKADGYTIAVTSVSSLIQQHLHKVPYDFVKDFTPIMQYSDSAYGIVVLSSSPWKTLKEFLDYAKANPGKIRYSSYGPGTTSYLIMASLAKQLKIEWDHIPFEGGPPALAALLGGHVDAYSSTMHCKSHIMAGRLRLLASCGDERNPSFPDVPTLKELGFPVVAPAFYAIFGPRNLPADIVEIIHQAFKKGIQDPTFIKACGMVDQTIVYRGPKDAADYLKKLDGEIVEITRELKLKKQ
jgi:tripartite-type tricarboxylate transporter receptor subunit TctC